MHLLGLGYCFRKHDEKWTTIEVPRHAVPVCGAEFRCAIECGAALCDLYAVSVAFTSGRSGSGGVVVDTAALYFTTQLFYLGNGKSRKTVLKLRSRCAN